MNRLMNNFLSLLGEARKSLFVLSSLVMLASSQISFAEDFLDPEVAFKVSAKMVEPGIAEIQF